MSIVDSNLAKNALAMTGYIEPAYITIHDYRAANKGAGVSAAVVENVLQHGGDLPEVYVSKNKNFRVQFNPAEVQIFTSSETLSKLDAQRREDEISQSYSASAGAATAELSFVLYFDRMYVHDSFMLDKPVLPVSAGGLTNAFAAGTGLRSSVQKEVEGFIAALQNPLTRMVTFSWAEFRFTGSFHSVSAQYIMFSTAGRPVRAKVSVRLRQFVEKKYIEDWEKSFLKAFGGDSGNLVRPEQNVSSILNLNF